MVHLLPQSVAVVDTETSGLSPKTSKIIEFAVVMMNRDAEIVKTFGSLVDPKGPVGATHIHGITAKDVAGKPLFESYAPHLSKTLANSIVVGHNVAFDVRFLKAELDRAGHATDFVVVCTMKVARKYMPELPDHKLHTVCQALGITLENAHTALADTYATAEVLQRLIARFGLRVLADGIVTRHGYEQAIGALSVTGAGTPQPIPEDWEIGEPLQPGDAVVFTGKGDGSRSELEVRAQNSGLRVTGSVSAKTKVLVTDGDYTGLKAKAALDYGTRIVTMSQFRLMLEHVTP